jgi:Lrp/AsnC family leucine-responsive transcriptional regulator
VEKIDLKDKKILYQLDLNSRQSFKKIGKKVMLAPSVVAYRINNLNERGIIKNFYTAIDVYKLGFIAIRLQFEYQYTTLDIEQKIIDYFVHNKHTVLVARCQGSFNLKVILIVKNIKDFFSIYQDIQRNYGNYFQNKSMAFFISELHYCPTYLSMKDYDEHEREKAMTTGGGDKIKLDTLDYQILRYIGPNARIPLTTIANALGTTAETVKYRFNKLLTLGIIKGFRVNYDLKALNYQLFKVYIYLTEYSLRSDLINYIKYNPYLVCIDTYVGEADIDLEFHVKDVEHLHQIMQDITKKFPSALRHYTHIRIIDYQKYLYMPEI